MSDRRGSGPPPLRALIAYHFFHPDDVVSARLFSDLAVGLGARGWDVTALTSVRSWSAPRESYAQHETWQGVRIERVGRPSWDQRKPAERLLNSAWLLAAWLARSRSLGPFDAVVLGSDPAFAPLLFLPLARIWPSTVLAHWCFDVYPEVIGADGGARRARPLIPVARAMMGAAYRRCDVVVDLGPRMRERLSEYSTSALRETLVPWALVEPAGASDAGDPEIRRQLFGEARLGLLYSGTLGRAHDVSAFVALARLCRARSGTRIAFAFSSRGHGVGELRRSLRSEDHNIRIVPFSSESELGDRLSCADIHLLSLRQEWSGLVVPSKFFGALAVGRPVLYSGPPDSDVARLIRDLNVGWTLQGPDSVAMALLLEQLAGSRTELEEAQSRARTAYDTNFRKDVTIGRWDALLRRLVQGRRGGGSTRALRSGRTRTN